VVGEQAISARLVAKVVLVAAAVVAALYFVYLIRQTIGLVLIAVLLALAIAPAVDWLDQRARLPRALAILAVYLGIGGVIFGIGLLIVPPLVDGVEELSSDLPGYVEDLRESETFREYDDRYEITEKFEDQAAELPAQLGDAAGTLRDVTVGVFSRLLGLFLILVISFFLLMQSQRILNFLFSQFEGRRQERVRQIADDISDAITGYVFGAFVIALIGGFVTYLTLTILDIPFAVPLAILAAFLGLIPLVGATLAGILIGIVVGFTGSFPVDLIVWAAVVIVYQQIENNLLQPFVYGRAVALNPLLVIVAILIGASLLGVLGALVAIPVAASVQALVRDLWRYRTLPTPSPAG